MPNQQISSPPSICEYKINALNNLNSITQAMGLNGVYSDIRSVKSRIYNVGTSFILIDLLGLPAMFINIA